jgi:lipoprotein-anchoring transpeptidase ErfK/SrfK
MTSGGIFCTDFALGESIMLTKTRRLSGLTVIVAFCASLLGETSYAQRILGGSTDTKPPAPAIKKQTPARTKPAKRPPSASTPANPAAPAATKQTGDLLDAVAVQAALDRAGFSPGIIDGKTGQKTKTAIRAFQTHSSLPSTGELDAATRIALQIDSVPAVREYVVSTDDTADIGPNPRGWLEKSKLQGLRYPSLDCLIAERGHCSRALLGRLNAGMNPAAIKPGDVLKIPNVESAAAAPHAERLEVDFGTKTVHVYGADGREIALFHCSIAKNRTKRPSSNCTVRTVTRNPEYLFDPKHWPEVKNVKEKLVIPAGPRNPVGLCWIGLSLKGYGIHGTPEPEMIGKTGSHGCFRLTNWDALRLATMVKAGTPVHFVDTTTRLAANR